MRTLLFLAICTFIPCLFLPITGEEGIYASGAFELLRHHDWLHPTILGTPDWRPPLLQWLNVGVFYLIQQCSMLLAMRIVAIASTLGSLAVLMWLTEVLWRDRRYSYFVGLCYLSGDVLLRRGWLAYADPTFSFFLFSAMACLWVSVETRRQWLMPLACIALSLAFLTKVITAYIFYGIFALALFFFHRNKSELFRPASLLSHLGALGFYLFWILIVMHDHGKGLIADLHGHSQPFTHHAYMIKLLTFPFSLIWQLLPISLIAIYLAFKQKTTLSSEQKITGSTFSINALPYWIVPHAMSARYLLPIVPLGVLFLTRTIWELEQKWFQQLTLALIGVMLVLKCIYVGYVLPTQAEKIRGNFGTIAADILQRTQGATISMLDFTYVGVDTVAHLDELLYPHRVVVEITKPAPNTYVLDTYQHPQFAQLVHQYKVGTHTLYLYKV